MTNSVIRRYTPPTCRLQILADSSPMSRWVGRSVVKQLRFNLRFDDPRLPEQRVFIQGDHEQLEALHEAVTTYVQNLLNSSPEQFNGVSAVVAVTPRSSDVSTDAQASSAEPQPPDPFSASAHLVDPVLHSEPIAASSERIFLQQGDGLSHKLFLGQLANKESGPVIQLSVLQLFDLATVLDEYGSDVIALPTDNRSRVTAGPSAWASIAAVLLIGVGLTTAVLIFNRSNSQQQTANRNATQGSNSTSQQPLAPQRTPVPIPTPLPSSQSPSLPPTSSIFASPSPSSPPVAVPGATSTLPVVPSVPIPQTTPVNPIPSLTPAPPILLSPIPRQDTSVSIAREPATPRTIGIPTPTSIAPPSITIPSPSQPTLPNPDQTLSETAPGAAPTQSSDTLTARSRSLPNTPNQPKATADTFPQVAEARDYFKQRWEAPSSLKQTLEYSLVLDVDGTIQRIEPLGEAARTYVDRTGMPLIGEQFVSRNSNGQTPRIRVVLAPDGKVQTFLEEDDPPAAAKAPNNRRLEGPNLPPRGN